MRPQDRETVRRWIVSGASLNDVIRESLNRVGVVGNERFSPRATRLFIELWTWSAPRYDGTAGKRQTRAYAWGGMLFLHNRRQRCAKIVAALKGD